MNMLFNSKKYNSGADAKKMSAVFPCNYVIIKHTILLVCFFVIFLLNISLNILSILIKVSFKNFKETLPAIC